MMNNEYRSQEHQKHIIFIREITRQLCHPKTGLPKDLYPQPVTLGDWNKCLKSLYGWVNVGIEKNVAEVFHELQIGEVIPSTSPNMDIYNYGFATSEIGRILNTKSNDKSYRAIINYYSFSRLIEILMNSQSNDYCVKFNNSLRNIFTDVKPDTFWLNILVPPDTAEYLKLNEIGEVIVKEGSGENAKLESKNSISEPAIWKINDKEDEEDIDESYSLNEKQSEEHKDVFSEIKDFSEIKVTNESNNLNENTDNDEHEQTQYRLVMNNSTLLNLLIYACNLNGSATSDVNIFKYMGGEDDEFVNLFGTLQI